MARNLSEMLEKIKKRMRWYHKIGFFLWLLFSYLCYIVKDFFRKTLWPEK